LGAWVSNAINAFFVLSSDIAHTQAMNNMLTQFIVTLQMFFDNAFQHRLIGSDVCLKTVPLNTPEPAKIQR